jgi:solute carrier family 24 (sodium/potassium/calcium exchanger), member 6
LKSARHHSLALPRGFPSPTTVRRSLTDPLSQPHSPTFQNHSPVPWHIPRRRNETCDVAGFHFPSGDEEHTIRSTSATTYTPEEDDIDPKSAPLSRPLEQVHNEHSSSVVPPLHLDTSVLPPLRSVGVTFQITSPASSPTPSTQISSDQKRLSVWWPHFLPHPYILYTTLFPTVPGFRSKSGLRKILSIFAIPAVFCLTVTLPVIDPELQDPSIPSPEVSPETATLANDERRSDIPRPSSPQFPEVVVRRVWNRWLAGIQCLLAPLFVAFIFFRIILSCFADKNREF